MPDIAQGGSTETYFPSRAQSMSKILASPGLIIVYGRSGAGKSHGGYQLLRDPMFGAKNVLFVMIENSISTYDPPNPDEAQGIVCGNLRETYDVALDLGKAAKAGKRIPPVVFVDSLSRAVAKEQERYDSQQTAALTGESLLSQKGNRDTLAEYGDMGRAALRTVTRYRDSVPAFIIINMTTHEPKGEAPELAVEGKLIPKLLTAESNIALHIRSQGITFDKDKGPQGLETMPHVLLGKGVSTGQFDGSGIARFYRTQDDGEVFCKGHHALNLVERAYLPDILRKISGQKPLY